jgi:hypothetical protein
MMFRTWRARALLPLVVLFLCARPTSAQQSIQFKPPTYAELRGDVLIGRGTVAQAGGGISIPVGIYARFAVDGAAGATWRDGTTRASGRVDAIARFILDPYRESPIGLSFGGGLTVPYTADDAHLRPLLVAVVDVEGTKHGRFTPALQLGLGGGARLGVVLRSSPARMR